MKVVSGRMVSISQRTITTTRASFNEDGGVATSDENSEYIEIKLDTHDKPFVINSNRSSDLFIGKDDALDMAGVCQGGHVDIYGIRNVTDGSVYIVRPEKVENRSATYAITGVSALVSLGVIGMMAFDGVRDLTAYLSVVVCGLFVLAMIYCIFSLRRWGVIGNERIGKHTQKGDAQEMECARFALQLTIDERRRITPL